MLRYSPSDQHKSCSKWSDLPFGKISYFSETPNYFSSSYSFSCSIGKEEMKHGNLFLFLNGLDPCRPAPAHLPNNPLRPPGPSASHPCAPLPQSPAASPLFACACTAGIFTRRAMTRSLRPISGPKRFPCRTHSDWRPFFALLRQSPPLSLIKLPLGIGHSGGWHLSAGSFFTPMSQQAKRALASTATPSRLVSPSGEQSHGRQAPVCSRPPRPHNAFKLPLQTTPLLGAYLLSAIPPSVQKILLGECRSAVVPLNHQRYHHPPSSHANPPLAQALETPPCRGKCHGAELVKAVTHRHHPTTTPPSR
jgi:hypothetical protein